MTGSIASTPAANASASDVDLGRTDVGGEQERQLDLGERQQRRQPRPLFLLTSARVDAERGCRRERVRLGVVERDAGRRGVGAHRVDAALRAVGAQAVDLGQARVHDDRTERDAGAVLDRERGVDQLVDRRLLRQGHEHHLAARRVGEQLHHVGRLLLDRADLHRVLEAAGGHAGTAPRGRRRARRAR